LHAGTLVVQGDGAAIVEATGIRTTLGRIGGVLASIEPRPSRLHEAAGAPGEGGRLPRGPDLRVRGQRLRLAGRIVDRRPAGRPDPGDVDHPRRVRGGLDRDAGAGRLAPGARERADAPAPGGRGARCDDRALRRQDRNPDLQPHDGRSVFDGVDEGSAAEGRFAALLRAAALASTREGIEPMDQAIFRVLTGPSLPGRAQVRARTGVLPGRPFVTQAWQLDGEADLLIAVKGAPEAVLARCSDPPERLQALASRATAWAAAGLEGDRGGLGALRRRERAPRERMVVARPAGLRGSDPRRGRRGAAGVQDAGVRVVMMTGDAAATALAIARKAGLTDGAALTGADLDAMGEAELELAIRHVAVFARVSPAQKLRIVQALQRRGDVVAMTGDGVNDGPALRAADVGVAMGERGDGRRPRGRRHRPPRRPLFLLVEGIRAGRRIFANLQRAMGYLFAVHVPIVGLSLFPLLGGPVLLLPIHVVLLELIIDPACSLVFEAEPASAREMQVPPRSAATPLFSAAAVVRSARRGRRRPAGRRDRAGGPAAPRHCPTTRSGSQASPPSSSAISRCCSGFAAASAAGASQPGLRGAGAGGMRARRGGAAARAAAVRLRAAAHARHGDRARAAERTRRLGAVAIARDASTLSAGSGDGGLTPVKGAVSPRPHTGYVPKDLLRILLTALAAFLGGCASGQFLPDASIAVRAEFDNFDAARSAFESIEPYKTTVEELADPRLRYRVAERAPDRLSRRRRSACSEFVPGLDQLDPGIRDCILARLECRAFEYHVGNETRVRTGAFALDWFNFKRTTEVRGWQFDAIVAVRQGVVLFRNYGGAPHNERTERQVNPLGPFQGVGDSMSGLLLR
jgi:hypothetical protein